MDKKTGALPDDDAAEGAAGAPLMEQGCRVGSDGVKARTGGGPAGRAEAGPLRASVTDDDDDDDDFHRAYRLVDEEEEDDDDPAGRRLDDDPADEPLLSVEAAVAALTAGSDPERNEDRRGWLSWALDALLSEGFPDIVAQGRQRLHQLAAEACAALAAGPNHGPDVSSLQAWVARATDEDIERRFPLAFPALLHVDHEQLPRALWSLCSARLPPRLLKQVTAASAARRWPPLPAPGDTAGLAALQAAADAAVEHFKALERQR